MGAKAVLALCTIREVFSWGEESHKATAYLAAAYVDDADALAIQRLMGWDEDPSSFADQLCGVSNWADSQGWSRARHMGYYSTNSTGGFIFHCGTWKEQNCYWTGMANWTSILVDANADEDLRRESFKFIAHVIGDAFQPLHSGRLNDLGGSLIKRVWDKYTWREYDGGKYTLHQLWDKGLFYYEEIQRTLSETSTTSEEDIVSAWQWGVGSDWEGSAKNLLKWMKKKDSRPNRQCLKRAVGSVDLTDPNFVQTMFEGFAAESALIARDFAYLEANGRPIRSDKHVTDAYMQSRTKIMEKQIVRAGAELACYIRELASILSAQQLAATTTEAPTSTTTTVTQSTKKKTKSVDPNPTETVTTVEPKAVQVSTTEGSSERQTEKVKKIVKGVKARPSETTTAIPVKDTIVIPEVKKVRMKVKSTTPQPSEFEVNQGEGSTAKIVPKKKSSSKK
jgi:hypothetical protein